MGLGYSCYIIFDIDQNSNDTETVKQSRELLDLIGWPNDAIPPVIIEKRFAAFRETFEETIMNEVSDYSLLREEAKKHLGITKESKPLITWYIAKNLSKEARAKVTQQNMFPQK